MPRMLFVLLNLRNHGLHLGQNFGRVLVVDVSLQELQDVEPVVLVTDEVSKQHVQPVVNRNELVPVFRAAAQLGLIIGKACAREIVLLDCVENVFVRETRAVQRNADAGRENRVDEPPRIPHQHEAVACQL
jgi:hypothetical protein